MTFAVAVNEGINNGRKQITTVDASGIGLLLGVDAIGYSDQRIVSFATSHLQR
jgi:hypothetical protein